MHWDASDPDWLTSILCRYVPGACVTSLTVSGASTGTTTRRALRLTYNQPGTAAGLPTDLFVKCTSSLPQRLMLGLGGLIHGEPGFYAHVRPHLAIEAPVGYFGAVEERTWRSIVITDDVTRTRQAQFWRPGTCITREQAEDLVVGMAAWHGALWDSPQLSRWPWLRTPGDQMDVIDGLIKLANRLPAGFNRAGSAVPASLRARRDDLFDGMRRSMRQLSRPPRTFLHGDLHVANTYLTGDKRAGVADWQVALQGGWAHDFAYLLATALTVEDRRAWERELLDVYLDRLDAAGGSAPARDDAWEAYRAATFYPHFAWLYTLGRSRLQPSFQPDEVSLTLLERISAAIVDLGSLRAVGL